MLTLTPKTYIATLIVDAGSAKETIRGTIEIVDFEEAGAIAKATQWAGDNAVDGDVLQIVHEGKSVRSVPLMKL